MYKLAGIPILVLSLCINAQEIPDYRGEYTFTNSKVAMKGIRELVTEDNGTRVIRFDAKFPLGRINIQSDFIEKNNVMTSKKYSVKARLAIITDQRVLDFNQKEGTVTSKGKFNWTQNLLENENVFDPLNAQIQIRKNIIAGLTEFSLKLPDLKTGAIETNNYKVVRDGSFEVDGKIYPCKVVERIRLQDNRTTKYFLASELNYLIIKIEDEDVDGDTMLELKKLY